MTYHKCIAPVVRSFLMTERDMRYRNPDTVTDPTRLFTVSGLGLDHCEFIATLGPSFQTLPWDMYDVRKWQVDQLERRASRPLSFNVREQLRDYYLFGNERIDVLVQLADTLGVGSVEMLLAKMPCRRRAISSYRFAHESAALTLEGPIEVSRFKQDSVRDYRRWPREFAPMEMTPETCHPLGNLLFTFGQLVRDLSGHTRSIRLTLHQVSTVATAAESGTNSPEGIHQDGADYIVSALVVSRYNVTGGESRLYPAGKDLPYFATILQPGQGLFHADMNSGIWHDATPITVTDIGASAIGTRNTLGIDIYLE
jgi:hypothetical protein